MKSLKSSVNKTFAILEHFTIEKPEWSVTELAKTMDSSKSTVYRFLSDMEKSGAMYQDPDSGKYGLGLKLFELGNRVRIQSAFVDKTHPELVKVAENITETVHIAILRNKQVYYVDKVKSPQGLTINSSIGSSKPLHCSSLGKVLLAFSFSGYQEIRSKNILCPDLERFTDNTIANHFDLENELIKIRTQGYAIDREEYEIGLICVGVPIFNQRNEIVASLSAAGPANRFKINELKNYVEIRTSGADRIRGKIGEFKP